MPRYTGILVFLCLLPTLVSGQVGIGTANPDPSALLQLESTKAAFVLPRMSDSQMSAIQTPETGSMIYNNSENLPYFRGVQGWSGFDINSNPTIILSRTNGSVPTSTTGMYPMQLSASNVLSTSSAYFTVFGPGAITVSRSGVYLLSASMAVSNMPAGNRNYHLGVYRNGILLGYFSRSRLENTAVDYWGMTGTLMLTAQAGELFYFRYFINHNAPLTNVFQTICITKLN